MKPHPESLILIEQSTRKLWRISERATTGTGVSSDDWYELQGDLPSYPAARFLFDNLKNRKPAA